MLTTPIAQAASNAPFHSHFPSLQYIDSCGWIGLHYASILNEIKLLCIIIVLLLRSGDRAKVLIVVVVALLPLEKH